MYKNNILIDIGKEERLQVGPFENKCDGMVGGWRAHTQSEYDLATKNIVHIMPGGH